MNDTSQFSVALYHYSYTLNPSHKIIKIMTNNQISRSSNHILFKIIIENKGKAKN